ncbi:hypothetical protein CTA1_4255 [Colletotrichum tanaceti]|uniref:CENP-V/GFA domain-containing protein n=1 Tax=Colletotrichum tanaceti TaxID=1306861 RepID=A0A4U6XJX2_9PEZI|nr:hypothetical protein CTA1_4255 [Colletotrichum tanaceti]
MDFLVTNRYEVRLPDLPALTICGCTLCAKKGYVWAYDADDSLTIRRGCTADTLTVYRACDTGLEHEFCSTCGIGLFGTHSTVSQAGKRGINFRVLVSDVKGVYLRGQQVVTMDSLGKTSLYPVSQRLIEDVVSSSPKQTVRAALSDVPGEDLNLYTGGCECGAVQVTFKRKPLDGIEIKEDNCSICVRHAVNPKPNFQNGFIGVYPHRSLVTLAGKDQTQDYKFGRGFNGSPFCRICGVHCFGNLYGPPAEVVGRLPEATQEFVRKQLEIQPINIRVLDGVEWDKIDIKWKNEGTEGYFLDD